MKAKIIRQLRILAVMALMLGVIALFVAWASALAAGSRPATFALQAFLALAVLLWLHKFATFVVGKPKP